MSTKSSFSAVDLLSTGKEFYCTSLTGAVLDGSALNSGGTFSETVLLMTCLDWEVLDRVGVFWRLTGVFRFFVTLFFLSVT